MDFLLCFEIGLRYLPHSDIGDLLETQLSAPFIIAKIFLVNEIFDSKQTAAILDSPQHLLPILIWSHFRDSIDKVLT